MDGLLASLGPLQTFCGGSVHLRGDLADPVEPPVGICDGLTNAMTQGFGSIVCGSRLNQPNSKKLPKSTSLDSRDRP